MILYPNFYFQGEVPVKCSIKPLSDVYVQSLNAAKSVLQKKVLVGNILQKLHKSAGGFLDDVERDKVESGRSNQTKMHILLEILKTKDNVALTTFYKVLEASKYVEAAEKLKKEVALRGRYCSAYWTQTRSVSQIQTHQISIHTHTVPSPHNVSDAV